MTTTMPERGILDQALSQVADWLGGWAEETMLTLGERGINSGGGTLTIKNARVWTGDPVRPEADAVVIRNGVIVGFDAGHAEGRVVDAEGRRVVPGFQENHTHPQTPFVLFSPEAPMLFDAKSVDDVLAKLRRYVEQYPEDRYPRLFGWMSAILPDGETPRRETLDAIVPDRPCYLVHHTGHAVWANTKALEAAGVLDRQPDGLPGNVVIRRDPDSGRATGFLEESEFASTDGVLLRGVRALEPLTRPRQVLILRHILDGFSKAGVTAIWTKDGDPGITYVYEDLLRHDSLPVRTILDTCHTPFNRFEDIEAVAQRAADVRAAGLPPGFLRADGIKILVDLPTDTHQAWLFEPYADGVNGCGQPVFPLEELERQVLAADRLGLTVNLLTIGDRAVHEGLNLLERAAAENPPRRRRHTLEHAEFVADADLDRFRALDAVPILNWIGSYPEGAYQARFEGILGADRIAARYQRWKEMIAAGVPFANGADFPLGPVDPMIGIHTMVNARDVNGAPEGGFYPEKRIGVADALRSFTTFGAYARGEEHRSGMLRLGYDGDLVMLAGDILDPAFDPLRLAWTKVDLTVVNGHVVHEDFSAAEKSIDFLG